MAIAFTKQIQAGNGDCTYQKSASGYIASEQTIWLSSSTTPSNCRCGGFYFPNITIPKGQTIVSAYLEIYTDFSTNYNSGYEPVNVVIYGDDRDTSEDFNYINVQTPGSRTHTTASINWTITDYIDEEDYTIRTSPDIKTVIQEIIDRDGWASNNSISLLVESATESGLHSFYLVSYDNEPSLSAKLVINYNPRVTDTRSATIRGKVADNSSRSAKITGGVNSSRNASIKGSVDTNSSRSATITGKLATNDSRNASILGGVSDTRDASITGTYAWYHPDWTSRKLITIDKDKVANTNQVNFPILINIASDSDLSSKAQSNGNDIVFTNFDGTVIYPHEIEKYDSETGELVAHVKIPLLSYETDTLVYMYYGNGSCASQQDATNVWDSSFKGVWHMANTSDSKNSRSFTKKSSTEPANTTSGQIDGGQSFDGTDDYAQIAHNSDFDIQTNESFTVEAWINITNKGLSAGDNYQYFANKTDGADHTIGWDLYTQADGYLRFLVKDDGGTQVYVTDDLSLFAAGKTYVVGVRDVTNDQLHIYVNGVEAIAAVTDTTTSTITPSGGVDLGFLDGASKTRFVKGIEDELRISKSTSGPRSADWILTTYNTQKDPSTFYSLGVEETRGAERSAVLRGQLDWRSSYTDWKYRKKITIQSSQVYADLDNYTALIYRATDTDLVAHAKSDGSDIIFTDQYGAKLKREIENYNSATGELEVWVKCDVKDATDVDIFMYFGNSTATETNDTDTWDDDFKGVWHMKDNTESKNGRTFTKKGVGEPADTSGGQIDGAQLFDGSNDYAQVTHNTDFNIAANESVAVEAWIDITNKGLSGGDNYQYILGKGLSTDLTIGWYFYTQADGYIRFLIKDNSSNQIYITDNLSLFGAGKVYVVGIRDVTNDVLRLYVNGVEATTAITDTTTTAISPDRNIDMGMFYNNGVNDRFLKGIIDEVRFSKSTSGPRSANWIKTNYYNQSAPSDFIVVSDLETIISERSASITGKVSTSDTRLSVISGRDTDNSEINASTQGKTTDYSTCEASIIGKTSDGSTRESVLTGKDFTTNEIEAKLQGKDTSDSNREAVITGIAFPNSRDAVITGKDSLISEIDSRITGKVSDNSDCNAVIAGKDSDYSTREVVVRGKLSDSSEIEALIQGKITTESEINASITGKALTNERLAVIRGKDTSNDIRDASIQGKLATLDTRESTIIGKASDYSNINAKLTGSTSDFSEINAVIHGIDTIDNEINVVITGKTTDNSEIDATIHGGLIVSSEITAKVITGYPAEGEIDVVITGSLPSNDERNAKTYGKDLAVNERDSTIHGIDTISSSISAKITGGKIANIRDASITGKDFGSDSIEATIRGKLPNSSEISASLIGGIIETDTRSAVITGMYFGSERSALIVGAKCPYYTGDKHTWNERNKVNWYTDDIHPFQTKSEVDWFVKNKKTITRKIRKVSCS